jgi:hypothetical protein
MVMTNFEKNEIILKSIFWGIFSLARLGMLHKNNPWLMMVLVTHCSGYSMVWTPDSQITKELFQNNTPEIDTATHLCQPPPGGQ